MIKWIKHILKFKEKKPSFPSTFVFEDFVYDQWNEYLMKRHGWNKKELKQGWRYIK